MAQTGIRYLEARKVKGKTYYVWNPPKDAREAGLFNGRRTSFAQDFKAAKEAADAYNVTLDKWRMQGKTIKATKKASNTFEAAMDRFMVDREFRKLRPESQRSYRHHLLNISKIKVDDGVFGTLKLEDIRRPTVRQMCDEYERKHGAQSMGFAVAVAKRMFNLAKLEWEVVGHNPFEKMGTATSKRRTQRWTQAQVYHFYSETIKANRRSIGMVALLCYELVQRHVDMRYVRKDQFIEYPHGLVLRLTQSKTGTEVDLDCEHIRVQIEEAMEATDSEWLCAREDGGEPWTNGSQFAAVARRIMDAAGIPKTLGIRDLRRTGALELVEAGATHQQVKDQGGWLSDTPVAHYTPRGAETARAGQQKRLDKRRKAS